MNENNLILRALEPSDLDFLYTLENDQALWSVSNTLIPFSKYTLSEYILHAKEDIHTAKQVRFVLSNQDQTPLGCVDLFDYDPIHRRAGIGIFIEKTARNKGFAKIGLSLVEDYAFNRLQLHQLYAGVGEDNHPSIQLFHSAGYKQTGIKKDWNYHNKTFHNELIFQKIIHV